MYLFYRVFFCANKMTLDNRCWILETFVATSSNIPYGGSIIQYPHRRSFLIAPFRFLIRNSG